MNRIQSKHPIILCAILLVFTYAQPRTVQEINARVMDLIKDQHTFTINRGKAEGVIIDSIVLVHPNRGDNEASIEWDLVLAEAKIIEIREHESIVKVSRWIDTIKVGDCCDVYSRLPENFDSCDIAVLAKYDIMFLDHDNSKPLFDLADLIRDPSDINFKNTIDRLVSEARKQNELGDYYPDPIRGGRFAGATMRDALAATEVDDIEEFIEYVRYWPGRYINYDWVFMNVYVTWMINETPSGERSRLIAEAKPLIKKADRAVAEMDFKEALRLYKQVLEKNPDYLYANERIETINKVVIYSQNVEDDPKDVFANYELGLALYDLNLDQQAITSLENAKRYGYDSLDVNLYIGYAYASQKEYKKARSIFASLSELKPDNANINKWLRYVTAREQQQNKKDLQSYLMVAAVKYDEENYDDAIYEYRQALNIDPGYSDLFRLIARTVQRRNAKQEQDWAQDDWDQGDFQKAIERWQVALEICEEIADTAGQVQVLTELGDALYGSLFYDEAIKIYVQIVGLDPDVYDAYISLANSYKAKDDYENARFWVEKGISTDSKKAWGHNILGLVNMNTGQFNKAITNFQTAAELDTDYKYPLYNLGLVFSKLERYDEAQAVLHRALEVEFDYWDARHDLMNIETLVKSKTILDGNPQNIAERVRRGRAYYHLDDYEKAINELTMVVKKEPSNFLANAYLGYAYTNINKFPEGHKYLQKAFTIKESPNIRAWLLYNEGEEMFAQNRKDINTYLKLGESDFYWQYYDDAISDYEKARQLGADTVMVYNMIDKIRVSKNGARIYELANDYFNRAEYQRAFETYEQAFEQYHSVDDLAGEYYSMLQIGNCYSYLFQHNEALKAFQYAKEIAGQLMDQNKEAQCYSAIGDYYWNMGDYEEALTNKYKARELYYNDIDLVNEAWMFLSIGALLGDQGDFDKMIEYYDLALDIHEKTVNYTGMSHALSNLGWAYSNEGDYTKTIDYHLRALAIAKESKNRWQELSSYNGLSNIYLDLGDTDNALKYVNFQLGTATAIGSKIDRVHALITLSLIYLELLKDYKQALVYCQDGLALSQLIGYELGEAVNIANTAVIKSRQGNYSDALEQHMQALAVVRRLSARYQEMQGLHELGETYFGLRRYDDAINSQKAAIEIAEALNIKSERWRYELSAGKCYEEKDDFENALVYYQKAAATLTTIKNKLQSEEMKKGFSGREKQTEVYKRLVELLIRMNRPDEAIKYIEESKSKIIKDAFGDVKPKTDDKDLQNLLDEVDKIERKRDAIERQLVEEQKKIEEEKDRARIEQLSKTLATTEGEFNQLMLMLKQENRSMYDALTINPASLTDIQSNLPATIILIEYFVSTEQLYVFGIGKDKVIAESYDITEDALDELIDTYLSLVQYEDTPLSDVNEIGKELYQILLASLEKDIEKYENVIIIPYGKLYFLPFSSLVRVANGKDQYLMEWKKISLANSATMRDILSNERRRIDRLFAIGNPDGSLPGAYEEVERIRNEIYKKNAEVLTLDDATKERFFNEAKNYNIVHLATHGIIKKNPLDSYLIFAGDTERDRRLTLLEVAGYTKLREQTDLVFLSACQTAIEKGRTSGSELISLAEAFTMAGPPSLIATLWKVHDEATSAFVFEFYRTLKSKKSNKINALREAQISLREGSDYSHPYFWAPFILIGDWR